MRSHREPWQLGAASDDVEWIDVPVATKPRDVNPDLELVRERLHVVVDDADELHVGADAFAGLWSKTPGQNAWAPIARTPGLRRL